MAPAEGSTTLGVLLGVASARGSSAALAPTGSSEPASALDCLQLIAGAEPGSMQQGLCCAGCSTVVAAHQSAACWDCSLLSKQSCLRSVHRTNVHEATPAAEGPSHLARPGSCGQGRRRLGLGPLSPAGRLWSSWRQRPAPQCCASPPPRPVDLCTAAKISACPSACTLGSRLLGCRLCQPSQVLCIQHLACRCAERDTGHTGPGRRVEQACQWQPEHAAGDAAHMH